MRKKLFQKGKKLFFALATVVGIIANTSTAEAGTSFATADPITYGYRHTVNFVNSSDAQYYKFTTDNTRGYYTVNFGKSSGNDKYLRIYEGNNASYSKILNKTLYSNGNATYTLSLIPNHTYYIECATYKQGGESNFTINKINDDFANTLAEATALPLGQVINGNIEVSDMSETDTFLFHTTGNNSFYEVSLSNTGNNGVYAYIYEGPDESYNYERLYASSADTSTFTKRLEKNKTYYIKIVGSWDDATHYKLAVKEISDDAGDDFTNATTIKNNKTTSKTIQISDDIDFFKFKTDKKKNAYQFSFKNKSTGGMYVTIYSNNDIASAINEVKSSYVSSASTKTIWLNLKKNRTYYVKVTGGQNCSYNVQFKDLKTLVKKTAPSGFKTKGYSGFFSKYAYLNWKHKYDNAKYEIYRSTSPKSGFKKIKTVQNTSYYYDYSVKKKHTYYYKIRYAVKDNGKYVTAKWSKVKKVKIK